MKKIGIILIIIGLIIALIPVGGNLYNKYQQKKLLDEFRAQLDSQFTEDIVDENVKQEYVSLDEVFKNEYTETTITETTISETTISETTTTDSSNTDNETTGTGTIETSTSETIIETSETTVIETTKKVVVSKPKVIGTLEIEKLNIDVLVVEGVSENDLKVGVGHFPGTAAMGKVGNCAIAGHRSYTFGKFFNRLNEMEIGDEIIVSNGIETFKYIVYKIHVVEPSETYVLNQVDDHSILTLVTCEPIYVASHRLIIHAKIEK